MAQPTLALSTAPTLMEDNTIEPRHLDLRPFILSRGSVDSTYVTTGGLTRVAMVRGSLVVNSSQGGGAKDTWIVDLEDSAPGLSPAELSRVFEPLYRAEASRSRDAGGSGLGLAIGEQIAKAHHGQLSASASELGGVLFQIQLPLQAAPAA